MKRLSEMTNEELWQLFPIVLTAHKPYWKDWFREEAAAIQRVLPAGAQIYHIGSTAIEGIWAKPIVDILVETTAYSLAETARAIRSVGYRIMAESDKRISLNKGYTEDGFAERVFHVHLQYAGDVPAEVLFRDYLNEHSETAKEYEALKLRLWKRYEHDRDAYTAAKGDFVKRVVELARRNRF